MLHKINSFRPSDARVINDNSGSNNALSPVRHQAIIKINAKLLWSGSTRTDFNQILIKTHFIEKYIENVAFEMLAFWSRGLWGSQDQRMGTALYSYYYTWCIYSSMAV